MIRRAALALAAAAAGPAFAAEGGAIRGGEHAGFSRIVMTIDPTTEWTLESAPGSATIFFPGKRLDFGTGSTFEKLPRSRITAVRTEAGDAGTTVEVSLGCDCRVSTAFVGARYLALDIGDRDAALAPEAVEAEAAAVSAEDPKVRAKREAAAVASAEAALIEQIERAASQGLIQMSDGEDDADADAAPAAPEPQPLIAATAPPPAPAAPPEATAPAPLPRDAAAPAHGMAALLDHDQIQATTVYDRDSRAAADRMTAAAVPPACLPDDLFDVGGWSNGLPMVAQLAPLRRNLVGEFDAPNPDGIRDLSRLYVRYGFGAEAEMLAADFPEGFEDGPLLVDLGRAVEGRPAAPGGPLAYPGPCPGRHGLWLALGGVAPLFHDAVGFASAQAAFAELPTDLRALLGPGLIGRLLDAGHAAEARTIYDTTVRPGLAPSAEMQLAEARLVGVEGHPLEATQALMALIENGAPNSVEALTHLVRLALDSGLPVPERVITDLRAAALQYRGSAREPVLRGLLAEALAQRADLSSAIGEVRSARADLPADAARFDALAVRLLAAADPATVGSTAYAETLLTSGDLVTPVPGNDAARHTVAAHLVDLGLPSAALELLRPPLGRNDVPARLLAARAHLRLGEGAEARLVLGDLKGTEAAGLRARAFAHNSDYRDAVTTLADQGLDADAAAYAWPSGDWPRARAAAESPGRVAMASYMEAGTGATPPAPSPDPAALAPEEAFQEPLPSLDRPTLDAARRLLATGSQLQDFVSGLLAEQ